jgi:hypothetical protein
MKCMYCNAENTLGELFCIGCGAPLGEVGQPDTRQEPVQSPESQVLCPHCGQYHPSQSPWCTVTGEKLPGYNAEASAAAKTARLVVQDGSEIALPQGVRMIQRFDFDRFISAEGLRYISKQHCTISFENGTYFIEDNNSKNGTLLNGVEIQGQGKKELKDGDRIEFGKAAPVTFRLS